MMFPATLSLIFAVTAIVPFVNLLTIPITTILLLITYALFLLLTYRTCWAAIAKPGRRTQIPESAPGRASKTTTM